MQDPEPTSEAGRPQAYWCRSAEELLAQLGTSHAGLPQREADARLATYGLNSVASTQTVTTLRLLVRQIENPLVLILRLRRLCVAAPAAVDRRHHHPADRRR